MGERRERVLDGDMNRKRQSEGRRARRVDGEKAVMGKAKGEGVKSVVRRRDTNRYR